MPRALVRAVLIPGGSELFHSGFYFANGFFPTEAVDFSIQLVAQILTTTLVALLILGRRARDLGSVAAAAPTPRSGPQA